MCIVIFISLSLFSALLYSKKVLCIASDRYFFHRMQNSFVAKICSRSRRRIERLWWTSSSRKKAIRLDRGNAWMLIIITDGRFDGGIAEKGLNGERRRHFFSLFLETGKKGNPKSERQVFVRPFDFRGTRIRFWESPNFKRHFFLFLETSIVSFSPIGLKMREKLRKFSRTA